MNSARWQKVIAVFYLCAFLFAGCMAIAGWVGLVLAFFLDCAVFNSLTASQIMLLLSLVKRSAAMLLCGGVLAVAMHKFGPAVNITGPGFDIAFGNKKNKGGEDQYE